MSESKANIQRYRSRISTLIPQLLTTYQPDFASISPDEEWVIGIDELREIIVRDQRIVKGRDFFELELSNAQTGEVFAEGSQIPRSSAVLVRPRARGPGGVRGRPSSARGVGGGA